MLRKLSAVFLLILTSLGFIAGNVNAANEQAKQEVVFADAGWDSVKFHNAVAGFIGTHAYNITPKIISGSTPIIQTALLRGDVDVHMELWTDNVPTFEADMKTGKLLNLGINFDDDKQGLYVPRYLIEGDAKRGIKALAPDLKTVKDLARYAHLFKDPEDPSKGRLYGAIPGWSIDKILYLKYEAYGLNKNYVYFRSGSEPALNSAFLAAYTKGTDCRLQLRADMAHRQAGPRSAAGRALQRSRLSARPDGSTLRSRLHRCQQTAAKQSTGVCCLPAKISHNQRTHRGSVGAHCRYQMHL